LIVVRNRLFNVFKLENVGGTILANTNSFHRTTWNGSIAITVTSRSPVSDEEPTYQDEDCE
jgi:hypothetical protein